MTAPEPSRESGLSAERVGVFRTPSRGFPRILNEDWAATIVGLLLLALVLLGAIPGWLVP